MWALIGQTFYLLLPAYAANMSPVIADRLGFLSKLAWPIDHGRMLNGEPLFGANKTWRGFVVGALSGMLIGVLQFFLWQFNVIRIHSAVDFGRIDSLTFGLIGGIGALTGDLVKSFIKRRFRISAGKPWPVFDQLDFILGYMLFTSFFIYWRMPWVLTALIMTLVLHPLTNIIGYVLRIKKVWW